MLASFSFFSFTNAFVLMDFADDYGLAETVLGVGGGGRGSGSVAFLYTLFLLCVMPAMLISSWGVVNHNFATMAIGQAFNVAGTWLRYVAAQRRSYALAVASTVLAGTAASAIVCSYAVIAEHWFRPSQRALATTVAVQSNYAGWALGSLLGLAARGDAALFADRILLWQAVVVSLSLPLFALCYRGPPRAPHALLPPPDEHDATAAAAPAPPAATAPAAGPRPALGGPAAWSGGAGRTGLEAVLLAASEGEARVGAPPARVLGLRASVGRLLANRRYALYTACYAVLAGIGFAVPSAQDALLGTTCASNASGVSGAGAWTGFDTPHTTFTNLAFILSGVVVGLLAGCVVRTRRGMEDAVLGLALVGALALSALAVLSTPAVAQRLPQEPLYGLLLALMALAGVATVGFIGMALNLAVAFGAPISEAYTVGGVEWLTQGIGGGLSNLSADCAVGFGACVALAWAATIVLACARFYYRRASALDDD